MMLLPSEYSPITIRPATPGDLEAINAIYNFYVLTSTATFDTEPVSLEDRGRWFVHHDARYPVRVPEVEGAVIGWCSLSPFHPRPAYRHTVEDAIYVEDEWRGRGVGGLLLGNMLKQAQDWGYHAVLARIGDSRQRRVHRAAPKPGLCAGGH